MRKAVKILTAFYILINTTSTDHNNIAALSVTSVVRIQCVAKIFLRKGLFGP